MLRFVLLLLLLLTSNVAAANLAYRAVDGSSLGWYTSATIGAAWTDITPTDLKTLTDTAIPASARFVTVVVKNRDAVNTLYFLARSGGATATADAVRLDPGESFTFTVHLVNEGAGPTAISVQGSGAGTDVDVVAWLVRP